MNFLKKVYGQLIKESTEAQRQEVTFQLECVFKKTGAAVCLFLLFTDLLPCVPAVL